MKPPAGKDGEKQEVEAYDRKSILGSGLPGAEVLKRQKRSPPRLIAPFILSAYDISELKRKRRFRNMRILDRPFYHSPFMTVSLNGTCLIQNHSRQRNPLILPGHGPAG